MNISIRRALARCSLFALCAVSAAAVQAAEVVIDINNVTFTLTDLRPSDEFDPGYSPVPPCMYLGCRDSVQEAWPGVVGNTVVTADSLHYEFTNTQRPAHVNFVDAGYAQYGLIGPATRMTMTADYRLHGVAGPGESVSAQVAIGLLSFSEVWSKSPALFTTSLAPGSFDVSGTLSVTFDSAYAPPTPLMRVFEATFSLEAGGDWDHPVSVPEPATYAMMLAGLLAVACRHGRGGAGRR